MAAAPAVTAAPVAAPKAAVVPPKAAAAPVVAKPPAVVAKPPVVAAAPVVTPKAAPAPVVAKPPAVVVAPVAAPVVAAKPPAVVVAPVAAPVVAPAKAPVVAKAPTAKAPVVAKAPTATAPALAPEVATAPVVAPALAPATGVPLDAAQVKALNAIGIKADADACSSIPTVVLTCDRNATTQHVATLSAQDCPANATMSDASLAALAPFMTELSFVNCALRGPLPTPTDRMAATLTSLTVTGAPVVAGWWIGRLTSLQTVHVQDTYVNISSSLDVIISKLANLVDLRLANTSINGGIPTTWPAAATLTSIDLSGNQLSGSIPIGITQIPGLTNLDLSHNRLNDHIISGLGNLANLQVSENQRTRTSV